MKLLTLPASLVLVIGFGCSKPSAPTSDAAPTTSSLETLQNEWLAAIDAERKKTYERAPLFPPGEKGAAATAYRAALETGVPGKLKTIAEANATTAWKTLPDELKTYAASPAARQVADQILRGALMSDGTTFARTGDEAAAAFRSRPAITVRLVALERGAAGKPIEGCKYLLGLIRMGQDMARGSVLIGTLIARGFELRGADALRQLVTDRKLSVAELREVLDGLTRLTGTRVLPGEALRFEILWVANELMTDTTFAGKMGMTPEIALAQLKEHRAIAKGLDELDAKSLPARQAFFTGKSCKLKGYEKRCKTMIKYIQALATRDASLEATRTFVALELYRRTNKNKVATKLEDLVPTILPAIPTNPLTGDAFGYESADAGRVIRVGEVEGGVGAMIPATIPAPTSKR